MSILILGHGGHGKTCFAKLLGVKYQDSSRAALDLFLYDELNTMRKREGFKTYTSKDQAYQDRKNWRQFYFNRISEYNGQDPSRLARKMLETNDCYVGMRSKREYLACMDAGLFDEVFWVDASQRKPPEEGSMDIELNDEMILIDNNGTYPELFDLSVYTRSAILGR